MGNKKISCSRAEQFLLLKQEGSLPGRDEALLEKHLHSCAACRQFGIAINRFEAAMDLHAGPLVQVRPQIIESLKKRMAEAKKRNKISRPSLSGKLVNFFKQPVPLYQAAIPALALILFMFILKPSLPLPAADERNENPLTIEQAYGIPESAYARDWKIIIRRQRGVSVSEDSLFFKSCLTANLFPAYR